MSAIDKRFPTEAMSQDAVLHAIRAMQEADVRWRDGRSWMYAYDSDNVQLEAVTKQAYGSAILDNGLSGQAFPSLARMEAEVVGMTGNLLGCDRAFGNLTSGGSESIFLAVKTARDWSRAKKPLASDPEIVLPATAHPAFQKAAHYLNIRTVPVPGDGHWRADPDAMEAAISNNTILIVASAPSIWHGVIDPVHDIARLARDNGVMLHVDACVGGFVLPFVRRLGRAVPEYDLSVDGVTSISADVHKYGYAPKGASIVLYRHEEHYQFQPYNLGGYSTPTVAGTRPGGAIAAAWAAIKFLAEPGYMALTAKSLQATDELIAGIRQIPELFVIEIPDAPLFAFSSQRVDLDVLASELREMGWVVGLRDGLGIHLTVTAGHLPIVGEFLSALAAAVKRARRKRSRPRPVADRY